jgi:hypothetical protein
VQWLTPVSEAMYLLARFHPDADWRHGRLWERWLAETLGPGGWTRQGPGSLTLFGRRSASGLRHEIDGAAAVESWTLMYEAKAYSGSSPTKQDLLCFDRKTFDLYLARRRAGEIGPHWRVLVSANPIDEALRRYCFLYGMVAVDPAMIPLPVLLRIAAKPIADEYFDNVLLAELVRLGETACAPMENRYIPEGHTLRFDMHTLQPGELDDLLWLQTTLTEEFLELVDQEIPGYFEDRAQALLGRLGNCTVSRIERHLDIGNTLASNSEPDSGLAHPASGSSAKVPQSGLDPP